MNATTLSPLATPAPAANAPADTLSAGAAESPVRAPAGALPSSSEFRVPSSELNWSDLEEAQTGSEDLGVIAYWFLAFWIVAVGFCLWKAGSFVVAVIRHLFN